MKTRINSRRNRNLDIPIIGTAIELVDFKLLKLKLLIVSNVKTFHKEEPRLKYLYLGIYQLLHYYIISSSIISLKKEIGNLKYYYNMKRINSIHTYKSIYKYLA